MDSCQKKISTENQAEVMLEKKQSEYSYDRKKVRKQIKNQTKGYIKKHYWMFLAACLIAAIMGTEYHGTLQFLQIPVKTVERASGVSPSLGVLKSAGNERYGYGSAYEKK
jgi:hypothetical protein